MVQTSPKKVQNRNPNSKGQIVAKTQCLFIRIYGVNTGDKYCMLCISTSFQVLLRSPRKWFKYFWGVFWLFLFFSTVLLLFCLKRRKKLQKVFLPLLKAGWLTNKVRSYYWSQMDVSNIDINIFWRLNVIVIGKENINKTSSCSS